MNERIRELAEQCFTYSRIVKPGEPQLVTHKDVEKFAELIVRECMSNLYLNGYDDAMMQIKQHFEIE